MIHTDTHRIRQMGEREEQTAMLSFNTHRTIIIREYIINNKANSPIILA